MDGTSPNQAKQAELDKEKNTMPFENHSHKDLTDQSQASSSRSGSPERLQQLRQAHHFLLGQESKGTGMMTAQTEAQDRQEKIQPVIKQRDGKTSPDSEVRLKHQKRLDRRIDANATIAIIKIHIQEMQKYHK